MKVAIIGLPQSGKSTVFSAITGKPVEPFANEPVHALVSVPDARLDYLAKQCHPKKVTCATMEFVDVPGAALDDAKGQEQWRRLLPEVRQAEGLVVVVRGFAGSTVPEPAGGIDPLRDFAAVWDELVFADLDAVTQRLDRLEKALKKPTRTHEQEKKEQAVLLKCKDALERGAPLSTVLTSQEDVRLLSGFAFLTQRPIVCACNVSDDQIGSFPPLAVEHVQASMALAASIEAEIAALDPQERPAFLEELGITEPASHRLVHACYRACGLISFLTMGPDEVRAWTVREGSTAVEAAAKIHTDLARGFIRAETVAFDELVAHSDMKGAKAAGKVRKEGKEYIVRDGDVMHILASV